MLGHSHREFVPTNFDGYNAIEIYDNYVCLIRMEGYEHIVSFNAEGGQFVITVDRAAIRPPESIEEFIQYVTHDQAVRTDDEDDYDCCWWTSPILDTNLLLTFGNVLSSTQ